MKRRKLITHRPKFKLQVPATRIEIDYWLVHYPERALSASSLRRTRALPRSKPR